TTRSQQLLQQPGRVVHREATTDHMCHDPFYLVSFLRGFVHVVSVGVVGSGDLPSVDQPVHLDGGGHRENRGVVGNEMYGQTSSPDVSKQCLDLVILYMIGDSPQCGHRKHHGHEWIVLPDQRLIA